MALNRTEAFSLSATCASTLDPNNISTTFPNSFKPIFIIINAINGIAALPTFYINLLVIWTILEKQNLRSTCYNILLAILALPDLLVGVAAQPLFISVIVCQLVHCTSLCSLRLSYNISFLFCLGTSISTLAMTSVERYLAIEHPMYYRTHVTIKKVLVGNAVLWFLTSTVMVVSKWNLMSSSKISHFPMLTVAGFQVFCISFCVLKVNLTARRQMRAINFQQASIQSTPTQNRIKEYKRTFTLGGVVGACVLCYAPALIIKIVGLTEDAGELQAIRGTCIHLQAIINPIFLALRLSYIRAGVYKKLKCCWN